jgi:hypothetical protein
MSALCNKKLTASFILYNAPLTFPPSGHNLSRYIINLKLVCCIPFLMKFILLMVYVIMFRIEHAIKIPPPSFPNTRFNVILPSTPRSPNGLFHPGFPILNFPHARYTKRRGFLVFGRSRVQISVRKPTILTGYFSWFSSVHPGKCRYSALY